MVFLSDVSPGEDLQDVIAQALASCKLAIILATRTYGAKTNGLFDTSSEMNYIVSQSKPYYLVRMIPFGENWDEPRTTMAFPPSIMQKVRTPKCVVHLVPSRVALLTLLTRARRVCLAVVARRRRRSNSLRSHP